MKGCIIYHDFPFYIYKSDDGFEIYKEKGTHAVRVAKCSYAGEKGFAWCKAEIERRKSK